MTDRARFARAYVDKLRATLAGLPMDDLDQLLTLLSEGHIHPVVTERFPLIEAARAHEVLAAGSTTGKLVLTFD